MGLATSEHLSNPNPGKVPGNAIRLDMAPVQQQLVFSSYVGEVAINYWLEKGKGYPSAARLLSESKPPLEAFRDRWRDLARSGQFKDTTEILAQIQSEGQTLAAGLEIFKKLRDGGDPRYNLGGHTAGHISQLLSSEGRPIYERAHQAIERSKELSHSMNAPEIAYFLCEPFVRDPAMGREARTVQSSIAQTKLGSSLLGILGNPTTALFFGVPRLLGLTPELSTGFRAALAVNIPSLSAYTSMSGNDPSATTLVAQLPKFTDLTTLARTYLERKYGRAGKEQPQIPESEITDLIPRAEAIHTNADPKDAALFFERLQKLRADVRDVVAKGGDFDTQLEGIRKRVFREIPSYVLNNYLEKDGVTDGGANCIAASLLFVDAINYSGLQFPSDKQLGFQVYKKDNHVEPVIYDTKTQTARGLVDQLLRSEIVDPIYHPDIRYYGYLVAKSEPPKIDMRDLLIAGEYEDATYSTPFLSWPIGVTKYPGKGPQYASRDYRPFDASPQLYSPDDTEGVDITQTDQDSYAESLLAGATVRLATRENYSREYSDPRTARAVSERTLIKYDTTGDEKGLLFRRREDLQRYQSLGSPSEKREFIKFLAIKQVRDYTREMELPHNKLVNAITQRNFIGVLDLMESDPRLQTDENVRWAIGSFSGLSYAPFGVDVVQAMLEGDSQNTREQRWAFQDAVGDNAPAIMNLLPSYSLDTQNAFLSALVSGSIEDWLERFPPIGHAKHEDTQNINHQTSPLINLPVMNSANNSMTWSPPTQDAREISLSFVMDRQERTTADNLASLLLLYSKIQDRNEQMTDHTHGFVPAAERMPRINRALGTLNDLLVGISKPQVDEALQKLGEHRAKLLRYVSHGSRMEEAEPLNLGPYPKLQELF